MTQQNSFTYKLTPEQQDIFVNIVRHGNYRPIEKEHTIIAASADRCQISLYKSGKCLIQGKGAADFVTFVLEPMVIGAAGLGYEDVLNPEDLEARMGIDESGKGDLFGPIVIAGAYADENIVKAMREMNVRDSKNISSDKKILELGSQIRRLLGKRFSIVKIGPRAYNRLYAKMRNVNTLLSWGHARAIENLLETVPSCPKAISDQFGKKEQVEKALMKKGQSIELIQRHKAESDIAVAAASILAREAFVWALKDLEKKYEMDFPKGASAAVKEAAEKLTKKHGPEIMLETMKCHFKTTDQVLEKLGQDRSVLGPEGAATSKPKKKS
jgi:ribonuclease HIII